MSGIFPQCIFIIYKLKSVSISYSDILQNLLFVLFFFLHFLR